MTAFSQRDPRWADVKLGTGRQTLGQMGCLVTAMASVVQDQVGLPGPLQAGQNTDPGRLNRWLARNGGFVDGNLFVFGAVEGLGVRLEAVVDCQRKPAPMGMVMEALARGEDVVALVDFRPGGSVDQHWVRLLQVEDDDVLVMDPWLEPGYVGYWLMARYALPKWDGPERAIFRLAIYSSPPSVPQPPLSPPRGQGGRVGGEGSGGLFVHQRRLCKRGRRRLFG